MPHHLMFAIPATWSQNSNSYNTYNGITISKVKSVCSSNTYSLPEEHCIVWPHIATADDWFCCFPVYNNKCNINSQRNQTNINLQHKLMYIMSNKLLPL